MRCAGKLGIICFALMFTRAEASYADVIKIDEFLIIRDGGIFFDDSFGDGLAPPNAPNFNFGTPANYFVTGTFAESGGKALLNSGIGGIVPSINSTGPSSYLAQFATLNTNTQPVSVNPILGLKTNRTFTVSALFDLSVPSVPFGEYGIELTDRLSGIVGNDTVRLEIARGTDGISRIRLDQINAATGSFQVLASTPIAPGNRQISLGLVRPTFDSNEVIGSFQYVNDGVLSPRTNFGPTGTIFNDETWTRATFFEATPVPSAPSSDPTAPAFRFPINSTGKVYLKTEAGGQVSDGTIDPFHQLGSSGAYYSLDLDTNNHETGTVVSAKAGEIVRICTASGPNECAEGHGPTVIMYHPSISNSAGSYFTEYREFTLNDNMLAILSGVCGGHADGIIRCGDGNGVSIGEDIALGTVNGIANGEHLHFQVKHNTTGNKYDDGIGLSIETNVNSPTNNFLKNVTVGGRLFRDYQLRYSDGGIVPVGQCVPNCLNPDGTQIYGTSLALLPTFKTEGAFYRFDIVVGDFGAGLTTPIFVDPEIAVGYDYNVLAGPLFNSVVLPFIGDGLYDLYHCDATTSSLVSDGVVAAGEAHSFGDGGASCFRVLGIEISALLDPNDPTAFVTGLTFTGDGAVDFTMTAVTESVPETATGALLASGILTLWAVRRKRLWGLD